MTSRTRKPNASAADVVTGRTLLSGSAAVVTSTIALALAARQEGKGLAQPLNATSHWLYGDQAADLRRAGVDPTIVGFGTHFLATFFWASVFETSLFIRPIEGSIAKVSRATSIAALAAIVDYTITPKRFTPGWELVLSKRGMAFAYAGIAAAFATVSVLRRER